jgi:hypothetical protein
LKEGLLQRITGVACSWLGQASSVAKEFRSCSCPAQFIITENDVQFIILDGLPVRL